MEVEVHHSETMPTGHFRHLKRVRLPAPVPPQQGGASSSASGGPIHFEMSPRGQVRPRDPVADYLLEEEEQSTRTAWHDHGGGVNLLQPNGPPWYV